MKPYAPAVAVVGGSGSGKTNLIAAALPGLAREGRRVAVLKHAAGGYDLAAGGEGKDSGRFLPAGAVGVVLVGPRSLAVVRPGSVPPAEEALEALPPDGDSQTELEQSPERALGQGLERALEQGLERAAAAFGPVDLVIVEGFRHSRLAKILVAGGREKSFSGAVYDPERYPTGVIAVAADRRPGGLPEAIPAIAPGATGRWSDLLGRLGLPGRARGEEVPSGVILAGGRSTRIGRNKAMLDYGGRPLIAHVAEKMRPLVDELIVVASEGEAYRAYADRVVSDVIPGCGPLGGIHSGLLAIHSRAALFCACDQPFIPVGLMGALASAVAEADAAVPFTGGEYEPLVAVYARSCLAAIEEAMAAGRRRVVSFYPRVRLAVLADQTVRAFGDPKTLFLNVNSEEDYRRAMAIREGASADDAPGTRLWNHS